MSKEEILKKYHLDANTIQQNIEKRSKFYQPYRDQNALTLYWCCWEGENEKGIDLIKNGTAFYYSWYKSIRVNVPLLAAIFKNNLELFVTLLQYGCPYDCVFGYDPDIGDGWSPLALAAQHKRIEMVQILSAMDANVYLKTPYGTALEIAKKSSLECYKMILASKEKFEKECQTIVTSYPDGNLLNSFIMYVLAYSENHNHYLRVEELEYLAYQFLKQNPHSLESEKVLKDLLEEILAKSDWNNGKKVMEEKNLRTILNDFILTRNQTEPLKGMLKQKTLKYSNLDDEI